MDADGRKEKPHSCWLPCSRMGRRMSHKPEKANDQDQKKRKRKKRTKQTITCAVTHIRLIEANPGKLAALDQLLEVYLPLCQQYVALFCTQETLPDKYTDPVLATVLSDRLHRVAMQQAAGIAKSWRTNRQAAYDAYLEDLADYAEAKSKATASGMPLEPKRIEPTWKEWNLPELRVSAIQANAGAGGGGAIRGLDVRLLASHFHPGQRESPPRPCQTRSLS
jgi:hypothetical protein